MTVTKLHFLSAGRCEIAASMIDTRIRRHELVNIPIWSYLIQTTDGPILVDTGMPDECVGKPNLFDSPGEEPSIVPHMGVDDGIVNVISRTGYAPRDLICVVSTHSHFDHAGGLRHFPHTEVVMQRTEYESVIPHLSDAEAFDFWSTPSLRYPHPTFVNGLDK